MQKLFCFIGIIALFILYSPQTHAQTVEFFGNPSSAISSGAIVPEGKKMFWSSGIVADAADSSAQVGTYGRFGNTKTQALSILKKLQAALNKQKLSFKDVLFLRVYIAPDMFQNNKFDFQGWFDAYAQYFGTKENPIKPCRSTIGVAALVQPDKCIEIELVAVY
ncbi:RidA family protein [Runella sp.]|uniref:RidA family protein n=1 Tax=Runella sp. TaxID=1960881 RepID=UPI003D13FF03